MTKDDYLEIIKKIAKLAEEYYDEEPELESPKMKSMLDEVDSLNLDSIKLKICPKIEGQKTDIYVILDSECESPAVYEFPSDVYTICTETLYQVYTDYWLSSDFYDSMGIEFETLIALVMNCKELPIISVRYNAGMNNIRYWNSKPYQGGLLSMVTTEEDQYQRHTRR